ncbi:flagellar filament capping protein FliD [Parasporobacterium paucivorans]|uniref:Flagellar hook-associated protein 2 n=1 Tax=Parasporobacterium paucivorans DSM 15970 TaxID=1122934 RepID=A0A1M6GEP7_9FIRM|nr:flagellar filament capping protein FliD [Parasporobacterium paucivorans]SHJ08425.1 flagellar hook-associated protein 2 [Parasporobacterium paucivorans DSM 15970]
MSNISSTTGPSSASTIRGYGGLASGLDTDSLIKGMTIGIQAKIDKQEQSKQLLEWKMEACRTISSAMINFSNKYTSYTSKNNLSSASFFARNNIASVGKNSGCVSVTGGLSGAASFSVAGVKQLAMDASATSASAASDQVLRTGLIATDLTTERTINNLEGETLTFTYGTESYAVKLETGTMDGIEYKYDNMANATASINKALSNVSVGTGLTLADIMTVTADDTKFTLKELDAHGNLLALKSGSDSVLADMGFTADSAITVGGITGTEAILSHPEKTSDLLAGKSISFTYNGITKKLTMPAADQITTMDRLMEDVQRSMGSAFGSGRVKVSLNTVGEYSSFSFAAIRPDGSPDASSVLEISGADSGLLGPDGILGISAGESNRLNLGASLLESGLAAGLGTKTESDPLLLTINNVEIQGLTYGSTMKEVMEAINKTEGANVEISYLANADKFTFKSTASGASGNVEIGGESASVFGSMNSVSGQDALVTVRYTGSNETMDIVRGTNTFTLDGLNVTVKSAFGYTEAPAGVFTEVPDNEEIQFTATVDSDEIVGSVKQMIEDYNGILDMVNSQLSTKRNRDYLPLTDSQKEEMTDDKIEKWEGKTKAGLLFNDSTLRSLYDDFRFLFSSGSADKAALGTMGISVSTSYSDNGKLVLDETALKRAIESDPESVKDVFTRTENKTTGEAGGLMAKISTILKEYAGTTGASKGILIQRAGSASAPASVLNNTIQKEIDSAERNVERLKDQMKLQTDRYIKKFTSLETLISQMNSQSSWLSSALG